MKKALFLLLAVLISTNCMSKEEIKVVNEGKSSYKIVIPEASKPWEKFAAEELAKYIKKMSGAELPVVNDSAPRSKNEIILGDSNKRLKESGIKLPEDKWGMDGFTIRTKGNDIIIAGSAPRGTIYGVLELLEMWGVRFFTPDITKIPKRESLYLPTLDKTIRPSFSVRMVSHGDYRKVDFVTHLRLNGPIWNDQHKSEKHGLLQPLVGSGHSFAHLVPAKKYIKDHPEYFAMKDGKRGSNGNLCLTNPDVAKVIANVLIERMRKNPYVKKDKWSGRYWSVSQMDGTPPCSCPECVALYEKEGSWAGPTILLLNRVAEIVHKEFPHEKIFSLAYHYTEKPPLNIKCAHNVSVEICPIYADRLHSIAEDSPKEKNRYYAKIIEGWRKKTNNILIWDYATDFCNTFNIHPDYFTWAPNLRFYHKHGSNGGYMQGLPKEYKLEGELYDLRKYVLARLMWDVNRNPEDEIKEFCEGVYGKHGKLVFELMKNARDKALANPRNQEKDFRVNDWAAYNKCGFTIPEIDKWIAKFEDAIRNENSPEKIKYLELALMPLLFTRITMDIPKLVKAPDGLKPDREIKPEYLHAMKRFGELAQKHNIPYVRENRTTVENFLNKIKSLCRPQPIIALKNGSSKLNILPGKGGVLTSFSMYVPEKKRLVNMLNFYEAHCGWKWHAGPGWCELYTVTDKSFTGKSPFVTMTARLSNGFEIKRTVRLISEREFSIRETLTNKNDTTQKMELKAYLKLVMGKKNIDKEQLWALDLSKKWVKHPWHTGIRRGFERDEFKKMFGGGGWALRNKNTGFTRVVLFNPDEISTITYWAWIDLCFGGEKKKLAMNESLEMNFKVKFLNNEEGKKLLDIK